MKVASNAADGEIVRHFDPADPAALAEDFANVTNRVRSASESSGLRHLFSNAKKKVKYIQILHILFDTKK